MDGHDNAFIAPDTWILPIAKLTDEVNVFTKNISNVTSMVEKSLDFRCNSAPARAIFDLKDTLSIASNNISSIISCAHNFAEIAETPSSLLLDSQKIASLSSDLVVDATSSILATTASMLSSVRSNIESLHITDYNGVDVFSMEKLSALSIPDQPVAINSLSQDSLISLGNSLQNNTFTVKSLINTSLATSRLNVEIFTNPVESVDTYLADMNETTIHFNSLSASVYNEMTCSPLIDTNSLLFQAPTIEPYAAISAVAVLGGLDEDALDRFCVKSTDNFLDALGDGLETRLQAVNPQLASVYREGMVAVKSGHEGWIRHAGVSFRTLLDHLLRYLAPDKKLNSYFENPKDNMIDGEFSRNSKLRYIFREIACGSYSKMAEQDIKLAEATFFPSNEIVHKLSSPLSEQQMRVFCRRVQGCVSVILEVAGH
ncbi:MAG: hypothetical protein KAJ66_01270 [Candidatus Omnitrophica bacterium]|nr:hypothetical protein [Candidatus Omnitrophota bacterium]